MSARRSGHEGRPFVWFRKFIEEKGIDTDEVLEVEGPSGANLVPIGCLLELLERSATKREREQVQRMLVRIDYTNGDVRHYLTHLAKGVAL